MRRSVKLTIQVLSFFEKKGIFADAVSNLKERIRSNANLRRILTFEYEWHEHLELKKNRFLYKIGPNWESNDNLPIALCYNFSVWKFGFVSKYLEDKRTLFTGRRFISIKIIIAFFTPRIRPHCIIIWGPRLPIFAKLVATVCRLKIIFMEDSFLRSVGLGKNHTTPLSLTMDEKALHYVYSRNSTIIDDLNKLELSTDEKIISRKLIKDLIKNELFKYSFPSQKKNLFVKRGVGVLCQNPKDISLRYNNPKRYSTAHLIKEAIKLFPDQTILVRPHPDKKFNPILTLFWPENVVITDPDESLDSFLRRVDSCVTIASNSGLEALIRNKTVYVLGAPFYAGWGLTKDYVKFSDRKRKLSIEDLCWISYVQYPIFLADTKDKIKNIELLIDVLNADKIRVKSQEISEKYMQGQRKEVLESLRAQVTNKKALDIIDLLTKSKHVSELNLLNTNNEGEFNQRNVENDYIMRFLEQYTDIKNVSILWKIFGFIPTGSVSYTSDDLLSILMTIKNSFKPVTVEAIKEYELILFLYVFISEHPLPLVLRVVADFYAKFKFFDVAFAVEKMLMCLGEDEYRRSLNNLFFFLIYLPKVDENECRTILLNFIREFPSKIDEVRSAVKKLNQHYGFNLDEDKIVISLNTVQKINLQKVNSLLISGHFRQALQMCEFIFDLKGNIDPIGITIYSRVLSEIYGKQKAFKLLKYNYALNKSLVLAKELIRFSILCGDYEFAEGILNEQILIGNEPSENIRRKVLLGRRKLYEGYITLLDLPIRGVVKDYFGEKYLSPEDYDSKMGSIYLIPYFGPGDEIHYASYYQKLRDSFGNDCKIVIGCDYRLESIFSRSYPDIKFIGTKKPRNFDPLALDEDYSDVPIRELLPVLDNNGHLAAQSCDKVCMATDLVHHFLPTYQSHVGKPYLIPDQKLARKMKSELPDNKFLVGVNWRSSVLSYMRNEHYFTIQEFEPIFEIPNIQFVNLQYGDGVDAELKYIEEKYPGKLISVPHLDLYNDFDTTASLMAGLDLVVAPATIIVELSGAIGTDTILISNSVELNQRKITANSNKCVWKNNIEILDEEPLGCKKALITKLQKRIVEKSDRCIK